MHAMCQYGRRMRRQVGERAATNAPWKSVLRKGLNPQPLCMSDGQMELFFVAANRAGSRFYPVASAPLNVGSASDISEAPRNDGAGSRRTAGSGYRRVAANAVNRYNFSGASGKLAFGL